MIRENVVRPVSGLLALPVLLAAMGGTLWLFVRAAQTNAPESMALPVVLLVLEMIALGGFVLVQPNEASVLTLFGRYSGSVKDAGFWWVNPSTGSAMLSGALVWAARTKSQSVPPIAARSTGRASRPDTGRTTFSRIIGTAPHGDICIISL